MRLGEPCFFFFNDPATTEIYTLSLHDALPIFHRGADRDAVAPTRPAAARPGGAARLHDHAGRRRYPAARGPHRSEEHTSELQSQSNLVCRLLLEKKKIIHILVLAHLTPPVSQP